MTDFNELEGKTLVSIVNNGEEIIFTDTDGVQYRQYHYQDCCETVRVEDINYTGSVEDMLNTPILSATEFSDRGEGSYGGSETWTFYCIRTIKGSMDIRWFGESNGYYSESVDFERV